MDAARRATRYDLFKLSVAILLLILVFVLNRGGISQSPALISTVVSSPSTTPTPGAASLGANSTAVPGSQTSISVTATFAPIHSVTVTSIVASPSTPFPSPTVTDISESTVTPLPTSTSITVVHSTATATKLPEPTSAPLSSPTPTLTMTSIVASAPTSSPSATETNVIAPTPTPLPSPTATALPSSTSTPVASVCEATASRSHLKPGTKVTILRRLNFRSSPGIRDNWLLTNLPGTKVEVVGGPECVPQYQGAYMWWQIKLPNGQTGWSAEAPQYGSFYFMEPAQ
jgi:hypothetical protein